MNPHYLSTNEIAKKWGISPMRVRQLAPTLPGARKIGTVWVIPADAPRPSDGRRRPTEPQA